MSTTVNLAVDCNTDSDIAQAFEVLGRLAGGLVIEGIEARLFAFRDDDDMEDGA